MTLFDPQVIDATEEKQREIHKWMLNPAAQDFRAHLELQVLVKGSESVRTALLAEHEPKRAKLSEEALAEAVRAKLILDAWDRMIIHDYKFQILQTH